MAAVAHAIRPHSVHLHHPDHRRQDEKPDPARNRHRRAVYRRDTRHPHGRLFTDAALGHHDRHRWRNRLQPRHDVLQPPHEKTEGSSGPSGMAQSFGYLLAATGPALFGILHDATHSWTLPLWMLLVVSVIILVTGIVSGRDSPF